MPKQRGRPQGTLPRSGRQRLLLRLLRRPGRRHLRRLLPKVHPADIAQLFPLLTPVEQQRLLDQLFEERLAAKTLRELKPDIQVRALDTLPDNRLAVILSRLSADDAVDLLARLEEDRQQRLLSLLDPHRATRLENLMRFGEDTAGGMMTPDVASFSADMTVGETLDEIRGMAGSGRLFYIYVTDRRGHLMGIANLWDLVVSAAQQKLRDIMNTDVVMVPVNTPRDEVATVFSRYDLLMVPVVDDNGRLVGAITVDDALDVVEEEATEVVYRLANVDTEEGFATSVLRSARLRIPRLLLNLVAALAAAAVIKSFQGTLAKFVVLAVFLPILAGVGEGAGSQTLALIVRGMAQGEMDLRRARGVVLRQVLVGVLTGIAVGLVLALVAWLWEGNWVLSGILLFSMVINLVVASLLGAAVPLVLRQLKLDPALGSSILVSAATDVTGFFAFLGTASLLLHYLAP